MPAAFKGDDYMQTGALTEIRRRFKVPSQHNGRGSPVSRTESLSDIMYLALLGTLTLHLQEAADISSPEEINRLCAEGEEAADFLKTFVVQAKLNHRGNFGTFWTLDRHDNLRDVW